MLYEVNLPSLSPTMEEGKIVKWIKKEKDPILSGEVLFEVETDKATMEYESPEDGYIAKIISKEGETANVNQLVAIISDDLTFTQEDINNFIKNNNSDNKIQTLEINPSKNDDGTYPAFHDKGSIGGLIKGFFGYNGDPSLIEFITWIISMIGLNFLYQKVGRRKVNGDSK